MDRKTFQQALAYLGAAFDIRLPRERMAVYWDQLGGLRDEPFLEAIKSCVAHDERFPTIARLRVHYQDAVRREISRRPALPESPRPERATVISMVAKLREKLR